MQGERLGSEGRASLQECKLHSQSLSFGVCVKPCCKVLIVHTLGGKPRKAFVNTLLGLSGPHSILCNEESTVSY